MVLSLPKAHHWHAMELAKQAVELGARASIVSRFTGLPKSEIQRLFTEGEAESARNGRTGGCGYWYIEKFIVAEVQACVFYRCFRTIRALGYPPSDALVSAFKIYLRLFGEASQP